MCSTSRKPLKSVVTIPMKRNVEDTVETLEEGGQTSWRSEPISHFPSSHNVFGDRKEDIKGKKREGVAEGAVL